MSKPIRGISLYDFEKIQLKARMLSGLSQVCLLCFINSFEDDIFRGAFECLAEEADKLSEQCDMLMQDAEK